ncbi:hypothetical protein C8F01DRAFT_1101528, partial [Mycena amicta]
MLVTMGPTIGDVPPSEYISITESSTFTQRAKEWNTNPRFAECIDRTYNHCVSTAGRRGLETWLKIRYPTGWYEFLDEFRKRRRRRQLTAKEKQVLASRDPSIFMWNSAAAFYGVTADTLTVWWEYIKEERSIQLPPKTKPSPKRRKGESSAQWIARISGINDHKSPNIDLHFARHTAVAEYDSTRYLQERWRTDSEFFFADIVKRSKSIIPLPRVLTLDQRARQRYAINDAIRTKIILLGVAHLAWKGAADLFDYFAMNGLGAPAAIERTYLKDQSLVWRIFSVFSHMAFLQRRIALNFSQLVATSGHYGPFVEAWRDDEGKPHFGLADTQHVQASIQNGTLSEMDFQVIRFVLDQSPNCDILLLSLEDGFRQDPNEKNKLTEEMLECIGDLASAYDLQCQLTTTIFGHRFIQHVKSTEGALSAADRSQMRSILYFMDPAKLDRVEPDYFDMADEASRATRELQTKWNEIAHVITLDELLQIIQRRSGFAPFENIHLEPEMFNDMWFQIDKLLWDKAASLDRPGEAGRVASALGLLDPLDPKRPVANLIFLHAPEPIALPAAPRPIPAPYVPHIPLASSTQSSIQSGHAFVAGLLTTKEKIKTRGQAPSQDEDKDEEEQEEEQQAIPELLPTEFKLGKKVLKLFHRILESEQKEHGPAKGQVRWGEFETAMKRIGFEVIQTAGSSVRFDPPATTARPITFHRPHPDPLLTPHTLKWLGARL